MPPLLMMSDSAQVEQLVEHLFRHQAGRMVATLTRIFGAEHLQLAEDVVQETLIKALQQWSYRGIPENPEAWLMQVAKNRALDVVRRQSTLEHKLRGLAAEKKKVRSLEEVIQFDDGFDDDSLTMLFMGCHPALSVEMQVTLLLKTLGGFSVGEIARAFVLSEATVAQRIVRAKRRIRDANLQFSMPDDALFTARLDAVLLVLYLIFSEGYKAASGDALVRVDFCAEAIRLCELVLGHPQGNTPSGHALLALMYLQAARLGGRMAGVRLLRLQEQDRSQWNREAIERGVFHLAAAAEGAVLTRYHLEAGVAACHMLAPTYEATDWGQILGYYDQLLQINPSPFVALNRSIALAKVESVEVALGAAHAIEGLDNYYLYHATLADFEHDLGHDEAAQRHYQRALALVDNAVERRFLEAQLQTIEESPLAKSGTQGISDRDDS